MSIIQQYRRKWNRRWQEDSGKASTPEPHPMGLQWAHRIAGGAKSAGGPMLDAATGLGRGIATAREIAAQQWRFAPIYAVDISDVAIRRAKRYWAAQPGAASAIQWILADVTALCWPRDFFGLVCVFGFTDMPFFARLAWAVAPGGMMLYEGFSQRQLQVKPGLDPEWTTTPEAMEDTFPGWEVLTCEESESPPYRLRFAAVRPTV